MLSKVESISFFGVNSILSVWNLLLQFKNINLKAKIYKNIVALY